VAPRLFRLRRACLPLEIAGSNDRVPHDAESRAGSPRTRTAG
jgi:hypothetical protein